MGGAEACRFITPPPARSRARGQPRRALPDTGYRCGRSLGLDPVAVDLATTSAQSERWDDVTAFLNRTEPRFEVRRCTSDVDPLVADVLDRQHVIVGTDRLQTDDRPMPARANITGGNSDCSLSSSCTSCCSAAFPAGGTSAVPGRRGQPSPKASEHPWTRSVRLTEERTALEGKK